MGDSSLPVQVLPSLSSPVAASLVKPLSKARVGMQREVYDAALSGSVDVLQWHNNWKQERTAMGNNVLHVHMSKPLEEIHRSVMTDNVSIPFILYVVDETSENSALLQSNNKGDTPFHFAARFGHTGAVQEFLTRSQVINAGLLNKANNSKDTALHNATRAGHASIVVLLVEAGGMDAPHHMPNNSGFTVPGGFDQSPGKTIGLAVLAKKASFIAFLVSDTIAFTMSSLAVICYFTLANQNDLVTVKTLSTGAHLLNTISLGALMMAFVTGTYAVVYQVPGPLCSTSSSTSFC